MKKIVLISVIFSVILLQFANAAAVDVKSTDKGSVVIAELNNPAKFTLEIKNNGLGDTFEIYSLVGIAMTPKGTFRINSGETIMLDVEAYPSAEIREKYKGFFIFEYEISSPANGVTKNKLMIKIVPLNEVLEIQAGYLRPRESSATITLRNIEQTHINDVKMRFKSKLFDAERTFSMKPLEAVNISIPVDLDKIKGFEAGTYETTAEVNLNNVESKISGHVKYLEFGDISVAEKREGVIIISKTTTKTNEGNIVANAVIAEKRDIFTRLFTSHSPQPATTKKSGFFVDYEWQQELAPAESLVVTTRTNYTLPLIILLAIVIAVLAVKLMTFKDLEITKRVSFVKTKGGELALKIRLHVKAHKHLDNVQVIDTIPGMMTLYSKFGVKPDKVDEKFRRLTWAVQRLNAGEERVFSYIIYSKINVLGKLELPSATGIYEREGKTHEVFSNRTFFAAETANRED